MRLYFVDTQAARRHLDVGVLAGRDVVALLDDRGVLDGTPVFLDEETMMPVEPLCSWARTLSNAELSPATMKDYGRIIARFADFLTGRGRDLLMATESDVLAYKKVRTRLQERPIGGSAWKKEAQLLDQFYKCLVSAGIRNDLPVRALARGRSALAPAIKQRMDIRHLTLAQYRYFRDVGLGGQRSDSTVDTLFRGWSPHRNRAAADLALGTGMRWQEWATVLLPELGIDVGHPVDQVEFTVQACAKYGKARNIYVPEESMRALELYLLLERPEQAARSAARLQQRHRDLFVVSRIDHASGRISGQLDGLKREFVMSAMSADLRRITVRETSAGLEALTVFICHGGLMPRADSWKRYRHAAWRRMVAGAGERTPLLPRRRWRWHDLRHTYALQMLNYLESLMDGDEPDAAARRRRHRSWLSSHVKLNPLLIVSRRLGHSDPGTTYEYLEYTDDLLNEFDDAFRGWVGDLGQEATYAQIASHALSLEKRRPADASQR
ncbi:tyrosine-type recombinase/integrase [Amycolatopsis echigonensis]|nr:tyrosine-type recombinase/integrase [Amycolatopsis niigatensis]